MARKLYDVCKIQTHRIREMDLEHLKRYLRAVKPPKDSSSYEFLRYVEAARVWEESAEHVIPQERERFFMKAERHRVKSRPFEHAIWDEQVAAGCSISHREQVARDAEREGKTAVARTIRSRRDLGRRRRRR